MRLIVAKMDYPLMKDQAEGHIVMKREAINHLGYQKIQWDVKIWLPCWRRNQESFVAPFSFLLWEFAINFFDMNKVTSFQVIVNSVIFFNLNINITKTVLMLSVCITLKTNSGSACSSLSL